MSNTTFNQELDKPFSVDLLFNNEWPIDESARSYMKESYDDYVESYNKKEAAVLFSNTVVEYDSCDCGDGYGCSHGSWPYRISFANNDKKCEGIFEDEHSLCLTGIKNDIRIEDTTKLTMRDFVSLCELVGINLENKNTLPAVSDGEEGKYMCSECDTKYDDYLAGCPKCTPHTSKLNIKLPVAIDFGTGKNTMTANCPDEENEISIGIRRGRSEVYYSMDIEEAEQLRDFLINHINNFHESNKTIA